MLPPPPHYEPCQDFLLQGDVGMFPFAQIAQLDDLGLLPGVQPPPPSRMPVYPDMSESQVVIGGATHVFRHWMGLGIVISQTSELRNSPDDSRVTVAPLVPRDHCGVNWTSVANGEVAGIMGLPAAGAGSAIRGMPEADWPDMVLQPRSATTLSRRVVEAGRLMTLTPPMSVVLAAKLAEFYAERQWARLRHFDNVNGRVLVSVDDNGRTDAPPASLRWATLTFDNHERMQVLVNPRT